VHRATTAVSVRTARGVVIKRDVIPTIRIALRKCLATVRGRGRIVLESGPLAPCVKEFLETRLREVVVCDRRRTRLSTSGLKSDRFDADRLSGLLHANTMHCVYVPIGDPMVLRRFAIHYERMVCDRTRTLLRLKSLFSECGVQLTTSRSVPQQAPIHRLRDHASREIAKAHLRHLDLLGVLIAESRAHLLQHARTFESYEILQTIPYIGEVRAAEIVAVIGEVERFTSLRRFWSYAGLGVLQRLSSEHRVEDGEVRRDETVRGIRMAHAGQRLLKKVIRDAAFAASFGNGVFRQIYDRHLKRGKPAGVARTALARKIAAVVLKVWRSGFAFDAAMVRKGCKSSGRASDAELGRKRTRAIKTEP